MTAAASSSGFTLMGTLGKWVSHTGAGVRGPQQVGASFHFCAAQLRLCVSWRKSRELKRFKPWTCEIKKSFPAANVTGDKEAKVNPAVEETCADDSPSKGMLRSKDSVCCRLEGSWSRSTPPFLPPPLLCDPPAILILPSASSPSSSSSSSFPPSVSVFNQDSSSPPLHFFLHLCLPSDTCSTPSTHLSSSSTYGKLFNHRHF